MKRKKLETEDPREGLAAGDVSTRSAAARDLARIGGWEDLPQLLELALEDKSSAVRLYTAAATADIAGRLRGAPGQDQLSEAQRAALHQWVRRFDPGQNPGLLMLLSAAADPSAVQKLGRMLRDPRNLVRGGAATALRRLALSGAAQEREDLASEVGAWLRGGRLPADAVLELVRLAGDAGWQELREEIRSASVVGRPQGEAVVEALERLDARRSLEAWSGLWWTDGLDVMEVAMEPRREGWMAIEGERAWQSDQSASLALREDGGARIDDEPARLIWARQLGSTERRPALQRDGWTWWKHSANELLRSADHLVQRLDPEAARVAHSQLEGVEGAAAARSRGLYAWRAGELEDALASLQPLADKKKPRADILYWVGRVRADRGEVDAARPLLEAYLGRAGKRAGYREPAEVLLAEIAGGNS